MKRICFMRNLLAAFILWMVSSELCADAFAATITSTQIDDKTVIFITGRIELGDDRKFRSIANMHDDAYVILESPGGATITAIQIGEVIRLKGYSTAILRTSLCTSACGLVWLAGSPRYLQRGARVGFHATYIDSNGAKIESGVGNAVVGRYFTLLNLPLKAVIFATAASPNSLNWLDENNFTATGIDVELVGRAPLVQSAPTLPPVTVMPQPTYSAGSTIPELWSRNGIWTVYRDANLNDSCFLVALYRNGTRFRIGYDRKIRSGNIVMLSNAAWHSLSEGQSHELQMTINRRSWSIPMKVIKLSNINTLIGNFYNNDVWQELLLSSYVEFSRGGQVVSNLSLEGFKDAHRALTSCQRFYDVRREPSDPFAN